MLGIKGVRATTPTLTFFSPSRISGRRLFARPPHPHPPTVFSRHVFLYLSVVLSWLVGLVSLSLNAISVSIATSLPS